ncbi:hypothetical protein LWI29_011109 [Acer saccharum]|uniref:Uncharacterized protein n=1 Tax=Acer saccharum TaxID=4024 RepID=A0AA39RRM8_ACESA|nr:hypothetical protein LWI29_011109 [Acer saccharum]
MDSLISSSLDEINSRRRVFSAIRQRGEARLEDRLLYRIGDGFVGLYECHLVASASRLENVVFSSDSPWLGM